MVVLALEEGGTGVEVERLQRQHKGVFFLIILSPHGDLFHQYMYCSCSRKTRSTHKRLTSMVLA
jgi:hypothetical protein